MQFNFRLTLSSDYHVGAGHGIGSQVDSALLRDADKVPALRGSTIEGLLRDGLWRLLQTTPRLKDSFASHQKAETEAEAGGRNRAAAFCAGTQACPLCQIFGTPAAPKRWRVSSARPNGADISQGTGWKTGETGSQTVARVRVSPRQRRAKPRSLFKQEEGDGRLAFDFTVECDDADEIAYNEAGLIYAAARMVRRFGSARRRGRGECSLELTNNGTLDETLKTELLNRFRHVWLNGNPALVEPGSTKESTSEIEESETTSTPSPTASAPEDEAQKTWRIPDSVAPLVYRIIMRTDEPVAIAKKAEAGNMYDGLDHINASTLWGALANTAAARQQLRKDRKTSADSFYEESYRNAQAYRAFVELFLRGGVRISPLYPAHASSEMNYLYQTIPMPLDVLTCKAYPGFTHNGKHGAKGYACEGTMPETCLADIGDGKTCPMPLQSLGGFLPMISNPHKIKDTKRRSEMHPRINPHTQRVATGDLYGYVALDGGQYFVGEIWCRNKDAWDALCDLTGVVKTGEAFPLRLGKATRRGYGKVTVWLKEAETDFWRGEKTIKQRLSAETEQPSSTAQPTLTLLLLTDAILPDAWGRYRQTIDEKFLCELIFPEHSGNPEDKIEKLQVFCKSSYVDNFNNHLGLPRWRDIALKAGSIIGFKLKDPLDPNDLQARLARIEAEGIGVRKHEGFGQIVFNHPFCQDSAMTALKDIYIAPPEALALPRSIDESTAQEIFAERKLMDEWRENLRRNFEEEWFRSAKQKTKVREQWEAVARWLHGAAGLTVRELKEQLKGFGEAKLLTSVRREKKETWETDSVKQARADLEKLLDDAEAKALEIERAGETEREEARALARRLLIEQLAERLMAAVAEER